MDKIFSLDLIHIDNVIFDESFSSKLNELELFLGLIHGPLDHNRESHWFGNVNQFVRNSFWTMWNDCSENKRSFFVKSGFRQEILIFREIIFTHIPWWKDVPKLAWQLSSPYGFHPYSSYKLRCSFAQWLPLESLEVRFQYDPDPWWSNDSCRCPRSWFYWPEKYFVNSSIKKNEKKKIKKHPTLKSCK